MTTDMKNLDQLSLVEMRQFVEGSRKREFKPGEKKDTYSHVEKILAVHRYGKLCKPHKMGRLVEGWARLAEPHAVASRHTFPWSDWR